MVERKRGRPQRHWAEDLRIAVWYKEIKRQSGWSDYRLNSEFAWTESGQELIRESKNGKGSLATTHRPRIFEWIRKTGKKPAGRDPRWRSMEEIVDAVDRHYFFINTKSLYEAKFWNLLQTEGITATVVAAETDKLLKAFHLIRMDYQDNPELLQLVNKYGYQSVFDRCLRLALRKMGKLAGIELLWYLNAQTSLENEIRKTISKIADRRIEEFFEGYFPITEAWNYSSDALYILLHTGLTSEKSSGYDFPDEITNWIILPMELKQGVGEHHLFHPAEFNIDS